MFIEKVRSLYAIGQSVKNVPLSEDTDSGSLTLAEYQGHREKLRFELSGLSMDLLIANVQPSREELKSFISHVYALIEFEYNQRQLGKFGISHAGLTDETLSRVLSWLRGKTHERNGDSFKIAFIQNEYYRRKSRNHRYSIRSYARSLGTSSTTCWRILSDGKCSVKLTEKLYAKLNCSTP